MDFIKDSASALGSLMTNYNSGKGKNGQLYSDDNGKPMTTNDIFSTDVYQQMMDDVDDEKDFMKIADYCKKCNRSDVASAVIAGIGNGDYQQAATVAGLRGFYGRRWSSNYYFTPRYHGIRISTPPVYGVPLGGYLPYLNPVGYYPYGRYHPSTTRQCGYNRYGRKRCISRY